MNVAIYVRKSKDEQDKLSLAVQEQACRDLAKREGFNIVKVYKDVQSRTENRRPDYLALHRALEDGEINGVLVYDTDRFSGSDDGELFRRTAEMTYREQFLLDCQGYDSRAEHSQLVLSVKYGVANLEVQKLRRRTRDSLRMRASKGYCAGGVPYGYRTRLRDDGYKELVILDEEAQVVRQVYEMAADGMSTRGIATALNAQGVPSSGRRKKHRKWMHSTIRGILRNPVYVGELVWNKFRVKRKPGSGRKERHPLPESEWVRVQREDLRIVSQELWDRVRERLKETAATMEKRRAAGKNTGGRKYTRLLSGLLKCGECGYSYVICDRYNYSCSSHRSGGAHACPNSIRVKRAVAEEKILGTIKDELLTDEMATRMRKYMQQYAKERKRELAASDGERKRLQSELGEVEKKIGNVVQVIVDGDLGDSAALASQLKELEARKESLTDRLASANESALDALPDLIPQAVARYRAEVEAMTDLSDDPDPRDVIQARSLLKDLLGDIPLKPHPDGYLVAHVEPDRLLPMLAGDACQRVRPGQDSNLRPSA